MIALLALAASGMIAHPTVAIAQRWDADDAPCKSAGSGVDTVNCLWAAYRSSDKALNDTYSRITSVIANNEKKQLQNAEKAWITYRDLECAAEKSMYGGGTAGLTAYPACLEALSRHREAELKAAYWWKVVKFGG